MYEIPSHAPSYFYQVSVRNICCSIFKDHSLAHSTLAASLSIIHQPFLFVKGFSKLFSLFFKAFRFVSAPGSLPRPLPHSLSEMLTYYIAVASVCQAVFHHFCRFVQFVSEGVKMPCRTGNLTNPFGCQNRTRPYFGRFPALCDRVPQHHHGSRRRKTAKDDKEDSALKKTSCVLLSHEPANNADSVSSQCGKKREAPCFYAMRKKQAVPCFYAVRQNAGRILPFRDPANSHAPPFHSGTGNENTPRICGVCRDGQGISP